MLSPQSVSRPDEIGFRYYVVALVDVLDQASKLRQLSSIPKTADAETRANTTVRETIITVERLRKAFEQFLSTGMGNVRAPFRLTAQQAATLRTVNDHEPARFQHFSDTMVFFAPVTNKSGQLTIAAVATFLVACARVMLNALGSQVPIRGAIDVGLATDCWPNEIYGCALTQVHDLERNVAQLPRIVVGDGLIGYLNYAETKWQGPDDADKFRRDEVQICRKLIAGDMDGVNFVDFLGERMRSIYASDEHFLDDARKALEFVTREHERFVQARDQKLAERYGRLRCYLSTMLSEVG